MKASHGSDADGRRVSTKNEIARRLLSSLSTSPLLLQGLFDEFSRGCAELSELGPAESADFSKEVSNDLFAILATLARLATYAERLKIRTPEEEDERRAFIERINNCYPDERSDVIQPDVELVRDPESGLFCSCPGASIRSPLLKVEPLSPLDIMQGYGYDHNNEEEGPLAPFLWFGNHNRSPAHDYVKTLIADWLAKRSAVVTLRVLDIGTGSCTSLLKLAQQLPAGTHLYACDICAPILSSSGISRLMACEVVPHLLVCDAMALPYRDEAFDIVTNFGSIDQVADTKAALAEMLRVLKHGGLAICRDEYCVPSELPLQKLAWYRHLGPSFGRMPPPKALVPPTAREVTLKVLNELNYVLSFRR